jgi:hypothetical protein
MSNSPETALIRQKVDDDQDFGERGKRFVDSFFSRTYKRARSRIKHNFLEYQSTV